MPKLKNWQLINNHLYGEIHDDEKAGSLTEHQ